MGFLPISTNFLVTLHLSNTQLSYISNKDELQLTRIPQSGSLYMKCNDVIVITCRHVGGILRVNKTERNAEI